MGQSGKYVWVLQRTCEDLVYRMVDNTSRVVVVR
jgi:hypothetical protein